MFFMFQEWAENTHHTNKLNPTLEERDIYSWIDRGLDLDTWSYPSKNPQPEPPHSIMLPGKKLQVRGLFKVIKISLYFL